MKATMTREQAVAELKAIDWNKWLEKLPQFLALFTQLIDLFKQPRPMMAHAPNAEQHSCLTEQEENLVKALLHNWHMQDCCRPEA